MEDRSRKKELNDERRDLLSLSEEDVAQKDTVGYVESVVAGR